jgi:GH24 family phage-related lysozyme (muramidase)
MHQSVADKFIEFSTRFEGRVNWMYLDVRGLVTVGIGNLIDPVYLAQTLPFRHVGSNERATVAEISLEWHRIKTMQSLAREGHVAAGKYATLHLPNADVDALVREKMVQFEIHLRHHFDGWDRYPADAQLGILSMAWAMGPDFPRKFPAFTRACRIGDWTQASAQCLMRTTGNPGLIPRNKANRDAFIYAQQTKITMGDVSVLRSV